MILKNTGILSILMLILLNLPVLAQGSLKPLAPETKLVSLLNGSDIIEIQWKPSPSKNVTYYNILRYDSVLQGGVIVARTYNPNDSILFFTYGKSVEDSALSFCVQAIDSISSNQSPLSEYHTLNLLKIVPDTCNYLLQLKWTGYRGWGNLLQKYQVEVRRNSGDPYIYGNLSSPAKDTSISPILSDTSYCILIRAIGKDTLQSLSNKVCISMHIPTVPSFINADYVSADSVSGLNLCFSIDSSSETYDYQILRSPDKVDSFKVIHSFTGIKEAKIRYTDKDANMLFYYNYKLAGVNSCLIIRKESSLSGNIVLQASGEQNLIHLSWNPYSWWKSGVDRYAVYRSRPEGRWERAGDVSGNATSFDEPLDSISYRNYPDKVCYYIQAVESASNPNLSNSNRVCVEIPPAVRIPNAFTPNGDGLNDEFKPIFDFIPSEYLLRIFDRNGNVIYETTNPSDTWKGTNRKSKQVPEGSYLYYLRYKSQDKSPREIRGIISVLYR